MKNAHRGDLTSYVQCRVKDLLEHLETEFKYAMDCYEDGTLSPRRSFQHIKQELENIQEALAPIKYYWSAEATSHTQPPATPESL